MKLKHGDNVTIGGIPATVDTRINTEGMDKKFLDENTWVKTAGLNHTGWVPNELIVKVGEPETIHSMLVRSRMLTDTARQRLRPFVDAISDHLSRPKDTALGVHWLGEHYSIKCHRGTGPGVSLAYDSIHTWESEDAIHFKVEIEYFNDEHSGDTESEWYSPLRKTVEIRAPLSLAEHFTKTGFEAWAKSESRRLGNERLSKAQEALNQAQKLVR